MNFYLKSLCSDAVNLNSTGTAGNESFPNKGWAYSKDKEGLTIKS